MDIAVGAVVSDHEATSDVGRNILTRGGSAVDAAIAMTICNGVRTFHSLGIGGGTFMVIHQKGCQDAVYIDGQCTAPCRLTQLVYEENLRQNGNVCKVGIPGTIRACKVAHDMYGRLPWTELFQPAIRMLREGFPIAKSTEMVYYWYEKYPEERDWIDKIMKSTCLSSIFRSNDKQLRKGDIITLPNLANTLEGIAEHGPDYIYNSQMTETIVKELQLQGGVHIVEDFQKYKALHGRAFSMHVGDYILHTSYGATGGIIVAIALNILNGYKFTSSDYDKLSDQVDVCHKLLEVIRFIMALKNKLGDPEFDDVNWIYKEASCDNFAAYIRSRIDDDKTHEQDYYSDVQAQTVKDRGTSHMSVLGPDGDTVSCTSTITSYFGSTVMSEATGILWNDSLRNFSKADSGTTINRMEPGKRPRSSMSPIIITDKQGKVVLAIGASGGCKIITALVQVFTTGDCLKQGDSKTESAFSTCSLLFNSHLAVSCPKVIAKLLWCKLPLSRALKDRRVHYNTDLDCILVESGFCEELKSRLLSKGHVIQTQRPYNIAVVEAIFVDESGDIHAHADSRKPPGKALYIFQDVCYAQSVCIVDPM